MFSKNETRAAKGVAILLLLFHHLFFKPENVRSFGIAFNETWLGITSHFAQEARVCVYIFILLSAYGLTVQLKKTKENSAQFIVKREVSLWAAFWPMYIAAALTFVIRGINPVTLYGRRLFMLFDFMGWADFGKTNTLTGTWWYMSIAQVIVILIPLLAVLAGKIGFAIVPSLWIVSWFLGEGINSNSGGAYLNYLPAILLGVYLAESGTLDRFMAENATALKRNLNAILQLVLAVLCLEISHRIDSYLLYLTGMLQSIAALLLIMVTAKVLTAKPLRAVLEFLGIYSGGIFMLHNVLFRAFPKFFFASHNAVISYLSVLLVSLAITVALEYIKKWTRYNMLIGKLSNCLVRLTASW